MDIVRRPARENRQRSECLDFGDEPVRMEPAKQPSDLARLPAQNARTWQVSGSTDAGRIRNRRTQRRKYGAAGGRANWAFSKNSPNSCSEDSSSRMSHLGAARGKVRATGLPVFYSCGSNGLRNLRACGRPREMPTAVGSVATTVAAKPWIGAHRLTIGFPLLSRSRQFAISNAVAMGEFVPTEPVPTEPVAAGSKGEDNPRDWGLPPAV